MKFGQGVTREQAIMAREFEAAGITTYSQAIKAFQRDEQKRIEDWKWSLACARETMRTWERMQKAS